MFNWQDIFIVSVALGCIVVLWRGALLWRGWGLIPAWALVCLIFVPCAFFVSGGSITPCVIGRSQRIGNVVRFGADITASQQMAQWGYYYLRTTGEIPAWNPCIFGGLPTEGSMLYPIHGNPVGWANMKMLGYHAEFEIIDGRPISFTLKNWLYNSAKIFVYPLTLVALSLLSIWLLLDCGWWGSWSGVIAVAIGGLIDLLYYWIWVR